ncbi:hypothetical protein GGF32_005022 [Allomyces javanicus]|nr:hypothetical protein GGF32_005022 [Allomyces javanicus]
MFPAAPPPPPARAGANQVRAMLARSRAAVVRDARQLVLDHAQDLLQSLHSTMTRAMDTRAMAEAIVADAADLETDVSDLVDALAALEMDLIALADKHGAVLHAFTAARGVAGLDNGMSAHARTERDSAIAFPLEPRMDPQVPTAPAPRLLKVLDDEEALVPR